MNFYNRVRDMLYGSRIHITSLCGKAVDFKGSSLMAKASLRVE